MPPRSVATGVSLTIGEFTGPGGGAAALRSLAIGSDGKAYGFAPDGYL